MPEKPEVITVVKSLKNKIIGKTIQNVLKEIQENEK